MTLFHHKPREPHVRLSVSVEPGLAYYARQTAKDAHVSLSAVVSDALRLHLRAVQSDEMVAGLREDAEAAQR